jgi:hypothetical protein
MFKHPLSRAPVATSNHVRLSLTTTMPKPQKPDDPNPPCPPDVTMLFASCAISGLLMSKAMVSVGSGPTKAVKDKPEGSVRHLRVIEGAHTTRMPYNSVSLGCMSRVALISMPRQHPGQHPDPIRDLFKLNHGRDTGLGLKSGGCSHPTVHGSIDQEARAALFIKFCAR